MVLGSDASKALHADSQPPGDASNAGLAASQPPGEATNTHARPLSPRAMPSNSARGLSAIWRSHQNVLAASQPLGDASKTARAA